MVRSTGLQRATPQESTLAYRDSSLRLGQLELGERAWSGLLWERNLDLQVIHGKLEEAGHRCTRFDSQPR